MSCIYGHGAKILMATVTSLQRIVDRRQLLYRRVVRALSEPIQSAVSSGCQMLPQLRVL